MLINPIMGYIPSYWADETLFYRRLYKQKPCRVFIVEGRNSTSYTIKRDIEYRFLHDLSFAIRYAKYKFKKKAFTWRVKVQLQSVIEASSQINLLTGGINSIYRIQVF